MVRFNLNRFGKLVRWSLTMDRRWFVKKHAELAGGVYPGVFVLYLCDEV